MRTDCPRCEADCDEKNGSATCHSCGLYFAVPTDEELDDMSIERPADNLNPSYYRRGGLESIDVIEAFGLNYRLGNCVKYLLRAGHKEDALLDLQKAKWYLEREISQREESCQT